ncbi:MAG: TIGR00266 family protein [Clostridia bacterium]|nr:TIGR00266 family protein [Clostridia bacterium]
MRYDIEGGNLPVAILKLDPGEVVISESGGRTWMRGPVITETTSYGGVKKALGRLFTGESLFMSKYTATGPAEMAFASSFPGRIIVRELAPGESIICQKTAFLCGMGPLELSVHFRKRLGSGFFGGEGFIMQKVTGPGIVFLEVDGYSPEYELAPGEQLVCDTGVLAVMDETCSMDIQVVKGAKNMFLGGEGIFNTVITGPGKVYLQSMTVEKLARLIDPYLPKDTHHD